MAWPDGTAMHTWISKEWLFLVACVAASCVMSTPFSTCTVDPVVIGHPAVVICSFEVDMRTDRQLIVAYHTKINSTEKGKIANCLWKGDDVGYKCDLRKGLLLDGEVSKQLRLEIEHADEDAKGEYICQKSPSKPSESTGCTLSLSDTSPVVATPANTTTNGPPINGGADDSPAVNVPAIVIPLVLAGLIVGVVVLIWQHRKRTTKMRRGGEKTNNSTKTPV